MQRCAMHANINYHAFFNHIDSFSHCYLFAQSVAIMSSIRLDESALPSAAISRTEFTIKYWETKWCLSRFWILEWGISSFRMLSNLADKWESTRNEKTNSSLWHLESWSFRPPVDRNKSMDRNLIALLTIHAFSRVAQAGNVKDDSFLSTPRERWVNKE